MFIKTIMFSNKVLSNQNIIVIYNRFSFEVWKKLSNLQAPFKIIEKNFEPVIQITSKIFT